MQCCLLPISTICKQVIRNLLLSKVCHCFWKMLHYTSVQWSTNNSGVTRERDWFALVYTDHPSYIHVCRHCSSSFTPLKQNLKDVTKHLPASSCLASKAKTQQFSRYYFLWELKREVYIKMKVRMIVLSFLILEEMGLEDLLQSCCFCYCLHE